MYLGVIKDRNYTNHTNDRVCQATKKSIDQPHDTQQRDSAIKRG